MIFYLGQQQIFDKFTHSSRIVSESVIVQFKQRKMHFILGSIDHNVQK